MASPLDYFYGTEAEQYTFFRIPKALISDKRFKNMSTDSKLLYGLMLDRMGLSLKNRWLDEKNRVYIIYTIEDIMSDLGIGREKVIRLLNELDSGFGLIEKIRRGLGKPNIIYIKNFVDNRSEKPEVRKPNLQKYENQTSRSTEIKLPEVPESNSNNTNNNNTDMSKTDFNKTILSYPIVEERKASYQENLPIDAIGWKRERATYTEIIKENIEYDILIEKYSKSWLDEIVSIMVDVICSREPFIRISKQDYPQEVVKSRFLEINSMNIEYLHDSLKENTSSVNNITAFLITSIYHSTETLENWYAAKVNHDFNKQKGE